MKVGFIGLGSIGGPVALNLVRAGYQVTVHDLQQDRARDVLVLGGGVGELPPPRSCGFGCPIHVPPWTGAD